MRKSTRSNKPVVIWIYIGMAMLIIQVILGGITRLTGSGLSITEWNVITGTLPPLHEAQWLTEFKKYQQTPQYALLNTDFTLKDFKFIFFWEWLHRFWARLIAFVFLIPFVIFLIQRRFRQDMIRPLLILFLLGALQGAIGWIMVASGLTGDAVYVKPTRLALHFVFALVLIAYAFWFALKLSVPFRQKFFNKLLYTWTRIIIGLIFLQLLFGALMAGHKAANAAPTWPTINGSWIPRNMFKYSPASINFIENKITIHFIHRGLAYLLLLLILAWTFNAFRITTLCSYFNKTRWLPAALLLLQVILGMFTVLSSRYIVPNSWGRFEWIAQLHQIIGMASVLVMIWMLYLLRAKKQY
ncbi:MAG: COX15/CtaA family protein [Chitinophagaceae bacterium]